jgi:hypothetical protein
MNNSGWEPFTTLRAIPINIEEEFIEKAVSLLAALGETIADILPTATKRELERAVTEAQLTRNHLLSESKYSNPAVDRAIGQLTMMINILGYAACSTLEEEFLAAAKEEPYQRILGALQVHASTQLDLSTKLNMLPNEVDEVLGLMQRMQLVTNHLRGTDVYFTLSPVGRLIVNDKGSQKDSAKQSDVNGGHLRDDLVSLVIGGHFRCGASEWIVTDIGTRTLLAIRIDQKSKRDATWLEGPPYALNEMSFDEEDIKLIELI